SWVDSGIDHGIIGGSLKSQTAQVDTLAMLAVRVLRGEAADSIPVAMRDLNSTQVDWRQLRRWGISESRVPASAEVKFRDPTVWERYKDYILAIALVFGAETALIAMLLVQRVRRRQAEERVHAREAQLRFSYDRIRDLGAVCSARRKPNAPTSRASCTTTSA